VSAGAGIDPNLNLYDSCKNGDALSMLKFIAWGADVKHRHAEGFTCLHAVCEANPDNALQCLELLAVNGADVDAVSDEEDSVLDVAVGVGNSETIAFLVAKIEGAC
jgi:ankyrin repeat protein